MSRADGILRVVLTGKWFDMIFARKLFDSIINGTVMVYVFGAHGWIESGSFALLFVWNTYEMNIRCKEYNQ